MSKAINLTVDNCIGCPYCLACQDGHTQDKALFAFQCTLAKKRIGGYKVVTEETPIPKWCLLTDSESMKYFKVEEVVYEVDDDTAVYHASITEYKMGRETWILGSWEKEDAILVDDINYVSERENKVVVIYGRIISEKEIDLDRGNTHPSRK